jgi:hypothetical protein
MDQQYKRDENLSAEIKVTVTLGKTKCATFQTICLADYFKTLYQVLVIREEELTKLRK